MSQESYPTHTVENQAPPLEGYNLFTGDASLQEGIEREGAQWAKDSIEAFGQTIGGEPIRWGFAANQFTPQLKTHDRFGNRVDEVEFHPAWHQLLTLSVKESLHALPWQNPVAGAHVARAAKFYLMAQVESGHGCPLSMTYSAIPAIKAQPEVYNEWHPRLTSIQYDPTLKPASQKTGALCGMAMTEKQGGSDVRANKTVAKPLSRPGPGQEYQLTGHKWFCSAPMCDAFLVLAQTEKGISCFFLPRFLPDGTKNRFFLQRLKDKLGNKSNASSEVEFQGTWARLIGEEGRGVPTIIEMVSHTRLDCVIGAAGTTRQAVSQAIHHATHRSAFGRKLQDQPLMQNVLADLCIESEAATTLMLRLARAYDESPHNEQQKHFARLATAVSKYWVCKRNSPTVAEALECLGGNGYVEDSGLPRLYREAPLNSIWEGSGNVICLDVLRAMKKEPHSVEAFFAELALTRGEVRLDHFVQSLQHQLADLSEIETRARYIVEQMALALQASLLLRAGNTVVAEAFILSRLQHQRGLAFGTLPKGVPHQAIIDRNRP
jgi:putative acyl-CoA dehydrogenase